MMSQHHIAMFVLQTGKCHNLEVPNWTALQACCVAKTVAALQGSALTAAVGCVR